MTKEAIFEAWAPHDGWWSAWAKPVLFSQMGRPARDVTPAEPEIFDLSWATASAETALIIELAGATGVTVGLRLAASGFRPVPLYNASPEPYGVPATVDVRPTMHALTAGAGSLAQLPLPFEAPPAFLLDADRNSARIARSPGVFDNRSISLPTDFPSANLLLSRGIRRLIMVTAIPGDPPADLSHTLRRYQLGGVSLLHKSLNNADAPLPIAIKRPRLFRIFWYNLFATGGLIRSPLGGFGGTLPMPSSG